MNIKQLSIITHVMFHQSVACGLLRITSTVLQSTLLKLSAINLNRVYPLSKDMAQ